MTFKFNNVYLKEVATIAGPYEKKRTTWKFI